MSFANPDGHGSARGRQERATRLTGGVLVAANLAPLYGVLFLNWDVFPLILLYWLENVWLGVLNIVRILLHSKSSEVSSKAATVGKLFFAGFFAGFFTVHYGMFCLVHGVFVFQLFGGDHIRAHSFFFPGPGMVLSILQDLDLLVVVAILALSHLLSLVRHYFWAGERHRIPFGSLMGLPYARIIILHVAILFGGFFVMALGSPVVALALLVLIKLAIDLKMHAAEHKKAAAYFSPR